MYDTQVMPDGGVQLASARVGFALSGEPTNGFDGNLAAPGAISLAWPSPSVVATYDGAHHWARSLAIRGGFWGLDVLNPNDVWAVGVTALYRSMDGGMTWQPAGEPPKPLVRVAFTTARAGLGLTVKGRLVQTNDSGDSWTASHWRGRGVAMCAPNARTILIADQNGGIWRSVNDGSRWLQVAPVFAPIEQYAGWPTQLSCQGSNAVELSQAFCTAACGGGLFTRVRQSTNDGRTWRTIATQYMGAGPTASHPSSVPNALLEAAAVGKRAACLLGGYRDGNPPGIRISCTAPGVIGYRKATLPRLPFLGKSNDVVVQGIDFLDAETGWLMLDSSIGTHIRGPGGDRATTEILVTHNGGRTWRSAYLSPSYRAVTCPGSGPATPVCWRNPLG